MNIKEFQQAIADDLNAVAALVQGGCKAFAEDTRTVYDEARQFVQGGGIAIVVVTPEITRNGVDGRGRHGKIRLEIQCSEIPALADSSRSMRALDAAETVARALDDEDFCWLSFSQRADPASGMIVASATFNTTILLD